MLPESALRQGHYSQVAQEGEQGRCEDQEDRQREEHARQRNDERVDRDGPDREGEVIQEVHRKRRKRDRERLARGALEGRRQEADAKNCTE